RPIRWLENTLSNSTHYKSCKEETKLQKFLSLLSTFETLTKLISFFKPFEKTTQLLGGENYCTLSLVTLAIEILIQNLKNSTNDNDNIVQTIRKLLFENLEEYSCEENNLNFAQLSQSQQSQSLITELFSEPIIQQQDTNTCNKFTKYIDML
ncbi:7841_t:CDS:2, partial [Cetraspora pellucida]